MFSGKTEELIRRLKRAKFARQKVEIFKPSIDTRYSDMDVVSHDQNSIPSTPIDSSSSILLLAGENDVVGIDEAQFLDEGLVRVCNELANRGIRVIVAELNRIASHLVFIGSLANDLGAVTGMIYAFRDREKILDLFDLVCGARMTFHYIRVGGVSADLPPEFAAKCDEFLKIVPEFMQEYEDILTGNEILQHRLHGTSPMTKEQALSHNMTGPNIRAVGIPFDIRKVDGYGVYPKFEFDVPVGENGDNWDRYRVRYLEIYESAKIIRQALDGLPEGDIMAKFPKVLRPPKGEVFSRTEGTRGELGFYIVSDGSTKPYRVHIRRPSFINLQGLDDMCRGMLIGDSVAAFSAIDPLMGEVDC